MEEFNTFYEKTYKTVYYTLSKYTVKNEDLEDLCQEVFLKALENWDEVKKHPNAEGWVVTTTRNVYSKHVRQCRHQLYIDYEELLEFPCEEDGYIEVVMDNLLDSVYGAKEREFVDAFAIEGYSIEELSKGEDKSNGSMRTKLYRARKKLKLYLESRV
ncbi:MAG: sigma-70 family RNA polymerase sigma factor [Lachnospiraceae bacterium]